MKEKIGINLMIYKKKIIYLLKVVKKEDQVICKWDMEWNHQ